MPCFYFSFPFQKEKLRSILIFPRAEGRHTFYVCGRMAPSQPPEDGSSQEHLFAPIEASPNRVPGTRSSLCTSPAALQYSFPTCPVAATAGERSSQGKLCLGPDMAERAAANVHPEPGPGSVARDKKKKKASSFPAHSPPGLARVLKEGEVNHFSSSYQYVAKPSCIFHSSSLKSVFFLGGFRLLVILNSWYLLKMRIGKLISPTRELLKSRR